MPLSFDDKVLVELLNDSVPDGNTGSESTDDDGLVSIYAIKMYIYIYIYKRKRK